jgi:hypothetical protein
MCHVEALSFHKAKVIVKCFKLVRVINCTMMHGQQNIKLKGFISYLHDTILSHILPARYDYKLGFYCIYFLPNAISNDYVYIIRVFAS